MCDARCFWDTRDGKGVTSSFVRGANRHHLRGDKRRRRATLGRAVPRAVASVAVPGLQEHAATGLLPTGSGT